MKKTALVTGSNRGIGLGFCNYLSKQGYKVLATCREASEELKQLDVDIFENVDVKTADFQKRLQEILNNQQLDLLINNAGIFRPESIQDLNYNTIEEQFQVNTLGPIKAVEACLPYLKKGSKIAMISSRSGSIGYRTEGGKYGYRMTKCALNMGSRLLSFDLKPQEIYLAIIHPGLVKTDMTGNRGEIDVDTSVKGAFNILNQLNEKNTGTFWRYDGEILPW